MRTQDDDSDELDDELSSSQDESFLSTGFVSRDKTEVVAYAKKLKDEFSIRSEIKLDPRHSNETTWKQWVVTAKSRDIDEFLKRYEFEHFDSSPKAFRDQRIEGAIFKGSFDLIEGFQHLKIRSASDDTKQFVIYPYDWDTDRWQVLEMDKSISYSDLWLATSNYEEEEEIIWPWDAGDDDWSRPLDTDEDID